MKEAGAHSFSEIMTQHESWQDAIAAAEAQAGAARNLADRYSSGPWLFVACGSPYFLARSAVALATEWLGRPAMAAPASELLLYPETVLLPDDRPLMIALSRSGETSETIGAARRILARGGGLLGIGCDADTTLMRMAEVVLELPAGREQSVAQTRSFSGMFLATLGMIAHISQRPAAADLRAALRRLPELSPSFVERARSEIGPFAAAEAIQRVFFLGSGVRYGLACEASIKMKEMSLTVASTLR